MAASSTIAAIATAPGQGGVGIIRLSGPHALSCARRVAPSLPPELTPRKAYYTSFVDDSGQVWDRGLVLYFAAPSSFTGEEVVELHAHGSPLLLQRLLSWVLGDNARLAQPGEFTRRAFLNGRMALSEAEAVADLISAESEAALRAASAQLTGQIHRRIDALYDAVLSLRADVEAALDFPAEAEGAEENLAPRLSSVLTQLEEFLTAALRGQWLRRGIRVVLFGPVNAGKSTLFNALCEEERALVDHEPGTTRDVLEARLLWNQFSVTLQDTAGLREGAQVGRVEKRGIERTLQALAQADLAILVRPPEVSESALAEYRAAASSTKCLEVLGKADVAQKVPGLLAVSGQTGEGLEALREAVLADLLQGHDVEAAAMVSERHAEALQRAQVALRAAWEAQSGSTLEVVAGELMLALEALGEVTGKVTSEALLDLIFQRFCIGK